jgi:hypothetical protein
VRVGAHLQKRGREFTVELRARDGVDGRHDGRADQVVSGVDEVLGGRPNGADEPRRPQPIEVGSLEAELRNAGRLSRQGQALQRTPAAHLERRGALADQVFHRNMSITLAGHPIEAAEQAGQRDGREWAPSRLRHHQLDHRRVRDRSRDELPNRLTVQRRELQVHVRDLAHLLHITERARQGAARPGPLGEHDHDVGTTNTAQQVHHPERRVMVGPLRVVEDEHQRVMKREASKHLAQGRKPAPACGRLILHAARAGLERAKGATRSSTGNSVDSASASAGTSAASSLLLAATSS